MSFCCCWAACCLGVSPGSFTDVEVDNIAIEDELEPGACPLWPINASQRRKLWATATRSITLVTLAPYVELAHSVKTHLGVRPLGHRCPLPVYGFGLAGGHPLPPPHHIRPIPVAGIVTLPFGLVPGSPAHRHSLLVAPERLLRVANHQVGSGRRPVRLNSCSLLALHPYPTM